MSYQQNFQGVIRGTAHGSVWIGKESHRVSIPWEEEIHAIINVDTQPVDHAVSTTLSNVRSLESGVIAGAALQEQAKAAGALAVGEATILGFSTLIFSEIDQQLKVLQSSIEAKSGLLVAEKNAVGERDQQFAGDFERIKGRYADLFNELNRELDRRIRAIDEPVFSLVQKEFRDRITAGLNASPAEAVVFAGESQNSRETLILGFIKRRIVQLLDHVQRFLRLQLVARQKLADAALNRNAGKLATLSLPVVALRWGRAVENPPLELFSGFVGAKVAIDDSQLNQRFEDGPDLILQSHEKESVERHLFNLVQEVSAEASEHDTRVAEYIRRWWSESQCQARSENP